MSVYKPKKSPYWQYDFDLEGRRFHGSTKAKTRREAEAVEKQLRAAAKKDAETEKKTGNAPLTMKFAAGRYWDEVGQHHRASKDTFHALALLTDFFGADKRLDEITDADVVRLVAWRRKHTVLGRGKKTLQPATINRSVIEPLRKLFLRARDFWGYSFAHPPVWRQHRLKEPKERVRELDPSEAKALQVAVRPDYEPWFQFASMTGLRLAETLISWDNVNWSAKMITTVGKGNRPVTTPITPEIEALLKPLSGNHPTAVFTYVSQRPRPGQKRGQHYPITYMGVRSEWRMMRARAGVKDFRIHDVRHDTATKLHRETKDLVLVSRALNHASVKTTMKYVHPGEDELRAGLSKLAQSRAQKSPE